MLESLFTLEALISLATLTALEIVLGIDNIIFIAILVGRLPEHQRDKARIFGLALAMGTRILLLLSLFWIMKLTAPLFTILAQEISGRDLILILGGLFLLVKSTNEIHHDIEEGGEEEKELKKILNGLELDVITMDRFMFLWRGIEHQLKKYGVTLRYTTTPNEKEIYEQLLTNRASPKTWDILTWGNDDWSSNNPWTAFFAYRISDKWSAIDKDDVMQEYIERFFDVEFQSEAFDEVVSKIVKRAYEKAYMLFVPSPNIVLAVNKEVRYEPSSVLMMPLWKAKLTKYHWSIRNNAQYPKEREAPMLPLRFDYD